MYTAFVLITTEIGQEEEAVNRLTRLPEVKEACMIYGVYDVIAKIEMDGTHKDVNAYITQKIRNLDQVRTMTLGQSRRLEELLSEAEQRNWVSPSESKERSGLIYLKQSNMFKILATDDNVDEKSDDNYEVRSIQNYNAYLKSI